MKQTWAFALVLLIATSGCLHWEKRGDALFHRSNGKPEGWPLAAPPMHRLKFPEINLGKTGRTVVRVRDLPAPMFPDFAEFDVPDGEDRFWEFNQTWRRLVLIVTFARTDGTVLHSTRLPFSQWQEGSGPGKRSDRAIYFRISPWDSTGSRLGKEPPSETSYDFIVDVLEPSPRAGDRMRVSTFRHVGR